MPDVSYDAEARRAVLELSGVVVKLCELIEASQFGYIGLSKALEDLQLKALNCARIVTEKPLFVEKKL